MYWTVSTEYMQRVLHSYKIMNNVLPAVPSHAATRISPHQYCHHYHIYMCPSVNVFIIVLFKCNANALAHCSHALLYRPQQLRNMKDNDTHPLRDHVSKIFRKISFPVFDALHSSPCTTLISSFLFICNHIFTISKFVTLGAKFSRVMFCPAIWPTI